MDYQAAWETATREWAFPPNEDRPPQPSSGNLEPRAQEIPSRDFRITSAHRIGEGSLRDKALDNIEAIRTLKRIEAENRDADRRGKIRARQIHRMGRDGERLPSLSAAGMADRSRATPRTADRRRVRLRARLDSERSLHLARRHRRHLAGHAALRSDRPARRFSNPRWASAISSDLCRRSFCRTAAGPASNSIASPPGSHNASIPDSTIFAKGFEETPLPDNFFDAVIGNIPFGNYPVYDPAYRRTPGSHAHHPRLFPREVARQAPPGRRAWRSSPAATRWTSRTRRSGVISPSAPTSSAQSGFPTRLSRPTPERKSRPTFCFCKSALPGAPASAETWQDLRPSKRRTGHSHQRIFRAPSRDDAGRDAARRHDVQERRADTRGRTDAGASRERLVARCRATFIKSSERPRAPPDMAPARSDRTSGPSRTEPLPSATAQSSFAAATRFEPAQSVGIRRPRASAECSRCATPSASSSRPSSTTRPKIASSRPVSVLNRVYDSFLRRYGPCRPATTSKPSRATPTSRSCSRSKPTTRKPNAPPRPPIFERRTLERYRPDRACRDAPPRRSPSRSTKPGEIDWPRMEQVTGRSTAQLATRTWQPRLSQSGGRHLGNRRPVSERQCPRQTATARAAVRARPRLSAQYRGP